MITAISKFQKSNSRTNLTGKSNNIHLNNITMEIKQLSFEGNVRGCARKTFNLINSKTLNRIKKITDESFNSARKIIRKLTRNDEIPFSEKPLIFKRDSSDIVKEADELDIPVPDATRIHPTVSNTTYIDSEISRKKTAINNAAKKLKEAGEKKAEAARAEKLKKDHSKHHHDDFDDNSDNLNNHHDTTSFRGNAGDLEHSTMDDFIANSNNAGNIESIQSAHGIGPDLSYENLNFNNSGFHLPVGSSSEIDKGILKPFEYDFSQELPSSASDAISKNELISDKYKIFGSLNPIETMDNYIDQAMEGLHNISAEVKDEILTKISSLTGGDIVGDSLMDKIHRAIEEIINAHL